MSVSQHGSGHGSQLTPAVAEVAGAPSAGVVWSGEIDVARVPELRAELETVPADVDVVIDLAEVTFLDSSGIGLLVWLRNRVDPYGARVRLVNAQPIVRRVLQVTGVEEIFS